MPDFAMIPRAACWIPIGALLSSAWLHAQPIVWAAAPLSTNLTSTGAEMDQAFRFELGVFEDSFVPTEGNKEQWAQYWRPAKRTGYNTLGKDFSAEFVVEHNDPPFTPGKQTYIWGFRGDALAGEWILFKNDLWTWPVPADPNGFPPPLPLLWFAEDEDTTAILGQIHASGTPFLMQSAAVTHAAPPTTTWNQWRQENLTGEALDGPHDDPDHDGTPNLLEFVLGTAPKVANPPVATPVILESGHAVITIPRRIDHQVTLTIEVSGDLAIWHSGPAQVEISNEGLAALVARDLTPPGPANPRRFIRLKASLP
jgi:hypothetical protein